MTGDRSFGRPPLPKWNRSTERCRMKRRWLLSMITGTALGCFVPTLTPGVAGCYEVEAPRWSPHLRPYPSALPRLIMLDSVFAADYQSNELATTSRRGWPLSDSVRITWSNEHSDWLLLPGDTIAVPRGGPSFHRLSNDSIVVAMNGAFGGFVALLASDGGGFRGLAYHRDERTFRQYSMPIALRRTTCPQAWTHEDRGRGAT